jgi:hypothetical protein
MERLILDEETSEKLKEFEEKVLKYRKRFYAKDNELTLDDFYGILDETIDRYTYLEEQIDMLRTELFYGSSEEDDYE